MSAVGILEARPPHIEFYFQPMEDREASLKAGCYVAKNLAMVRVTPQGSKDRIVRVAEDWIASQRQSAREQRLPQQWFDYYVQAFEAWKNGQELPVNGTPIKTWPPASPAQIETLLRLGLRTVEDLAASSEQVIQALGMGGRNLRALAETWLKEAKDVGTAVQELTALREEVKALRARNESLEQQVRALQMLERQPPMEVHNVPSQGAGISLDDILSDDPPPARPVQPPSLRKL